MSWLLARLGFSNYFQLYLYSSVFSWWKNPHWLKPFVNCCLTRYALWSLWCHLQLTGCHALTRLFALVQVLFPVSNDSGPLCAHRWADPCKLSIRAHSRSSSEEKSTGGAWGTLQATWLWGQASYRHHHPPQTQRASPQVPAILLASISAATAAPIWNLCHSPGEKHTQPSYTQYEQYCAFGFIYISNLMETWGLWNTDSSSEVHCVVFLTVQTLMRTAP